MKKIVKKPALTPAQKLDRIKKISQITKEANAIGIRITPAAAFKAIEGVL